MSNEKINEAKKDFKYLINRGYKKDYALNVVCNHYKIPKRDRLKIIRTIHTDEEIKTVKSKLIDIEKLSNGEINIDGYNVLIGIEAFLKNKIVLCDDGIYRDFMGIYGNYKINTYTEKAINLLFKLFKYYNIKPIFYFDAQVSKSGELSKKIRTLMEKYNIDGEVFCVKNCDYILMNKEIVATSDSIIIKNKKVKYVVDLVREIKDKFLVLNE
ncbi:DUF434 domain-containing protein [Methanothermococcus okinawensis]|uniref:DUF434 domain-containing protein n=1 Tax=Methanothermococcus okinawensis (strain DSM 14208 / JCM 11175 / IH1) TaxID=647113 RepID=F8AL72_METOI|nr:DUF434 domain-containing protein [Methanothermococcus okinawensis]AEH06562.1 protein of unknown function DUF434 [Methanothermococcus okinawensis IH1]